MLRGGNVLWRRHFLDIIYLTCCFWTFRLIWIHFNYLIICLFRKICQIKYGGSHRGDLWESLGAESSICCLLCFITVLGFCFCEALWAAVSCMKSEIQIKLEWLTDWFLFFPQSTCEHMRRPLVVISNNAALWDFCTSLQLATCPSFIYSLGSVQ